MADEQAPQASTSSGYGKRPLWQWILLYVVIAAVVYGLVYYFVFAKHGGYSASQSGTLYPSPSQTAPSEAASPSTSSAQKITVIGTEFAFNPATITVKVGQSVQLTFKNNGTYPHNLTISDLQVATKTIQPGQEDTISFTPTKAGSFGFLCTVPGHADRGMKGTLVVE